MQILGLQDLPTYGWLQPARGPGLADRVRYGMRNAVVSVGRGVRAAFGADYTEQVLQDEYDAAMGDVTRGASAAVEKVSGYVQWAFSRAQCTVGRRGFEPFDPEILGAIGRSLVTSGESLHLIQFGRRGLALYPVSNWTVHGSTFERDDWVYQCEIVAPSSAVSRMISADGLLHIISDRSRSQPWKGLGPLNRAHIATELASAAEQAIIAEFGVPVNRIIPMPPGVGDRERKSVKSDLRNNRISMPMSTRGMGNVGQAGKPSRDWGINRLGPEHTPGEVTAYQLGHSVLLSAMQMHPSMSLDRATGSAIREADRQLRAGLLRSLADVVQREASFRLEDDVRIWWSPDVADELIQARTAKAFLEVGLTPAAALEAAGIKVPDGAMATGNENARE